MGDSRLSRAATDFISNQANTVVVSAAVVWEVAIKAQLGKLSLPLPADEFMSSRIRANHFATIGISLRHAARTFHLQLLHRDPFDRILVAQAQIENIPLITADQAIAQYGVPIIW